MPSVGGRGLGEHGTSSGSWQRRAGALPLKDRRGGRAGQRQPRGRCRTAGQEGTDLAVLEPQRRPMHRHAFWGAYPKAASEALAVRSSEEGCGLLESRGCIFKPWASHKT